MVFPDYGEGWRSKIVVPPLTGGDRLNVPSLVVQGPSGEVRRARLPAEAYRRLVAATSMKQRTRKQIEYFHADRLGFAVAGTPNRLELDQGFFVKNGDGAADVKPIAHLYKTQVYALAEHLDVPEEIRARPPTTDTYGMAQTQEEFYFALPYAAMDLCLWGRNHGVDPAEVGAALGMKAEVVAAVYRDIAQKRRATRHLHERPLVVEPVREIEIEIEIDAARRGRPLMCGVAGILDLDGGPPPSFEELGRMIGAIRHRGPDELGAYRDAHVGLAHARLAILDVAGGRQPFAGASGEVVVSYNGEIYNHAELRAELEARGRAFRTRSDTEVLVAAYEAFGDACVERFEGQFAFALWDARRRRLLLARDRFGVRPLHVARAGRQARLRVRGEGPPPARRRAAGHRSGRASTRSSPSGARSRRAPPSRASPRSGPATSPSSSPAASSGSAPGSSRASPTPRRRGRASPRSSESEAAAPRRALAGDGAEARVLRRAGRLLRLGGLDSALVAALARRVHPGDARARSRSASRIAALDEGRFQRLVAERIEARHTEITVAAGEVARCFDEVVRHVERPVLRAGPAPMYLLSRAVRDAGRQGRAHRRGGRRGPRRVRPLPARPRCAPSSRGSPDRRAARACSTGSTRGWSTPRARPARWRVASSCAIWIRRRRSSRTCPASARRRR